MSYSVLLQHQTPIHTNSSAAVSCIFGCSRLPGSSQQISLEAQVGAIRNRVEAEGPGNKNEGSQSFVLKCVHKEPGPDKRRMWLLMEVQEATWNSNIIVKSGSLRKLEAGKPQRGGRKICLLERSYGEDSCWPSHWRKGWPWERSWQRSVAFGNTEATQRRDWGKQISQIVCTRVVVVT